LAVRGDGTLVMSDLYNAQVQTVSPPAPLRRAGNYVVPSPDGQEVYEFDGDGRHLTTRDALTSALRYRFHYDSAARLTSVEDRDGLSTTIEHDAAGNPTAIVSPTGQRTALTVDANGYLATVANPASETTTLTYSADGLMQTFTTPKSQVHTFGYDPLGRLTSDSDPAGGVLTLARSDAARSFQVTASTNLGRTKGFQLQYPVAGGDTYVNTDTAGLTTTRTLGTDGSISVTSPTGMVTATQLLPDPRFGMEAPTFSTMVTTPAGVTLAVTRTRAATTASSDPLMLATQIDTVTRNGRVSTSTYDAASATVTQVSAAGRQRVVHLDDKGRVSRVEQAGLEPVEYDYDARGRLALVTIGSGASAREAMPSYDTSDRVSGLVDPIDRTFSFSYDAANRVTQQTLPGPDGDRTVGLSYDGNGNLQSLTPPGEASHGFGYDAIDEQTSYTAPAVAGVASTTTTTAFNLDRQVTAVTRPDGDVVSPSYDAAGRLASLTLPDVLNRPAMLAATWSYDPTTGQLASTTGPYGGSISYSYDGSLLLSSTATGEVSGSVSWTYDSDFRPASETAGGTTVTFGYDPDSLLTSAGDITLSRDPNHGAVTGTSLGVVSDTRSYSTFGELASYSATYNDGAAEQFNVTYTRDKLGRIVTKVETIGGVTTTVDYGYDTAGRLHTVTTNGTLSAT
jgi:YD repeat-containing protein